MMSLSQYLEAKNLTQRDFARAVGISPSYMNEIVQRRRAPSISIAAKIEDVTGGKVSIRSLITDGAKQHDPRRIETERENHAQTS